jgi:hypothetical protein
MASRFSYRVKTVCTATVAEEWTVTSDRPLSDDQLADIVVGGELDGEDVPAAIALNCVEEEVSNEHDRSVTESYLLDEEDDEDEDDDDGCPKLDPDCTSRADECHDACEHPPDLAAEIAALRKAVCS